MQVGSVASQARPELPWGPRCVMSLGLFTSRMGPAPLPGTGIKGVGQPLGGTESLASPGGAPGQVALPAFPWPPGLSFPLCEMGQHSLLCLTVLSSPLHLLATTLPVMYPHPQALRFLSCSDPRHHLLSDPHHQDPCRAQGRSAYGLPHEHWLLPARREPLTGPGVQLRKAHVASRGQLKVTPDSLQVLCKGP